MDRWNQILTELLKHDETAPQHRGTITGPLITGQLALRIGCDDGPVLSALKALVRRGLVVQTQEGLKANYDAGLGTYSWSYGWRLTEIGKNQASWPQAPKTKPSKRKLKTVNELLDMHNRLHYASRKVRLMPEGPERGAALEMLVEQERELMRLQHERHIAFARKPETLAMHKDMWQQMQANWAEFDKQHAEHKRQHAEYEDQMVRLGRLLEPTRKLSVN